MKNAWFLMFFAMAVALYGCSPTQTETGDPKGPPSIEAQNPAATISQPTQLPVPTTQGETMASPTPDISGMESLIEMAKKDLAQRLSISVGEISLVEAKPVVWPDSSLGCPQPGMAYADVLTPGYLILLNPNGHDYEYHAGKNSDIFYCQNPTPPVPGMPGDI